jgi:hypothetical protein
MATARRSAVTALWNRSEETAAWDKPGKFRCLERGQKRRFECRPALPVYPDQRTFAGCLGMSVWCHNRKLRHVWTIGCQLPYISDRHSHSTGPYRYRPNHQALTAACIA